MMRLLVINVLLLLMVVSNNKVSAADPFHPDNYRSLGGASPSFSFWDYLIGLICLFIGAGIVAGIQSLLKKHANIEMDDGSFSSTGGCLSTLLIIVIWGFLYGLVLILLN